ncbi:MAG: hypothetical protein VX610_09340 [SAR324 cluster bacterium]|nr:hypothetical protein [SAR324 cluster bacterium]
MFHFIKNSTASERHEGLSAQLVEWLVPAADGSQSPGHYEGEGALQDTTASGTGLYAEQEFKPGSRLHLVVTPEGGDSGDALLEVLWTRHQDQDNITSICIRQMIFGQYEAEGRDIETDILKLLHNPSRFATADLIQRFSIFDQHNLKKLEQLKNRYRETHPNHAYRHGTRAVEDSQEAWAKLIEPILPRAEPAPQEASTTMQQFNRRQAHR